MEIKEIKDIAEATKDFMESLALLAGGMWGLVQFFTVRHDQHVKEQSVLCIELEISQAHLPGQGPFLNVTVKVRNQGSRNSYLPFDRDDHLTVTPVKFLSDGSRQLGQPIRRVPKRSETPIKSVPVLSGASIDIPFFVPVPATGLYLVRFYVEPNPEQRRTILKAGGAGNTDSIAISSNKYFIVEETHRQRPQRIDHAAGTE